MSYRPRKALIIGAGIAGPVAAILLRRAGIESAIYEAWAGIQYAAASRFNQCRLWNTGSSGQAGR
nr:NAD(P)-binding protein [Bradyrhizobium canariense]